MIAKKQMYIADFYFIRNIFDSAHGRYAYVLEKYSGLGYNLRALYGATVSAYKNKDLSQTKSYLERLTSEFPKSDELLKLKEMIKDGE